MCPADPVDEEGTTRPGELTAAEVVRWLRNPNWWLDKDGGSNNEMGLMHSLAADLIEATPAPPAASRTPQADRDKLAIDIEDAIIDHCGSGGTAALTDRILAFTDAYALASRTPQADEPDPSWPTCTNCECPIQPGETHRADRRWADGYSGSCWIDDLPALASRTPEPGDDRRAEVLAKVPPTSQIDPLRSALVHLTQVARSGVPFTPMSQQVADNAHARLDALAEALAARSAPLPTERPTCTGLTAAWCPIHGDCTCTRSHDSDTMRDEPSGTEPTMDDDACPLHSSTSDCAPLFPDPAASTPTAPAEPDGTPT